MATPKSGSTQGRDERRSGPDTQHRILAAATRLVASRGYRATTLKTIAQAVGISEPAIYRHYAGRSDLIASTFAAAMDQVPGEISRRSEECGSALEELRMVATVLIESSQHLTRRLLVEMHIAAALDPDMATPVAAYTGAHVRGIHDRIVRAIAEGSIPEGTDVDHAAWFLYVLIVGLAHLETIDPALIDAPAFRTWIVNACTHVLRMPCPAPRRRRPVHVSTEVEPEPRTPGTKRGERTRREILDVAMQLIVSHGYRATTMKSVSIGAGISEPAVYRYFPGKADLLAEVFRRAAQVTPIAAFTGKATWRDDVLPDYMATMSAPELQFVRRLGAELHSLAPFGEDVTRITHEHNARNFTHLRRLLQAGIDQGALPDDYDIVLAQFTLHVLMMGLCHQETINPHLAADTGWHAYLSDATRAILPLRARRG